METTSDLEIIKNKVNDYCEIIAAFSALLTEENAALEAYDVKKIADLYENKLQLVTAYRNMTAFFIKNQEGLKALDESIRAPLRVSAKALDDLLKTNDTLLKAKMETSKLVMDTVVNIAKMTNKNNSTAYGAQGNYAPADNNGNALSINRTL